MTFSSRGYENFKKLSKNYSKNSKFKKKKKKILLFIF